MKKAFSRSCGFLCFFSIFFFVLQIMPAEKSGASSKDSERIEGEIILKTVELENPKIKITIYGIIDPNAAMWQKNECTRDRYINAVVETNGIKFSLGKLTMLVDELLKQNDYGCVVTQIVYSK